VANRSKRLASLSEATTKELWASVKNKDARSRSVKMNGKLADPEELNSFFSAISTNPTYKPENIAQFRIPTMHHGPVPVYSWSDDDNIIYNYQIEPLLRRLKNTAPGLDYIKKL